MKMMCINDKWQYYSGRKSDTPDPSYGEIVTVLREIDFVYPAYILAEYPHPGGYDKKSFIPLSEIDEMELVNQREVECAE